jgi:hypothetical protein
MIKFDCGRAPGLEKRVRRELDEVERTEEKVADHEGGIWSVSLVQTPPATAVGGRGRHS